QAVRPAAILAAESAEGDTAARIAAGRTGSKPVLPGTPVPPLATFQPFSERLPVKKTKRNLPHWTQDGATYFVTFRLADAVPDGLLKQWKDELETWLKFHPEPWDAETAYEYWQRAFEKHEEGLEEGAGECNRRRPDPAEHGR